MLWQNLENVVVARIAAARASVVIVCPFIKRAMLDVLLNAVPQGVAISVYTRWIAQEVAAGVSDPDSLHSVLRLGGTMRLADSLHAKMFLVDGERALIGSANVTAAALGTSSIPNLELVTDARPSALTVATFMADLDAVSRIAGLDEMAAVLAKAQLLPPAIPKADDDGAVEKLSEASPWLPRFRSPERLFAIYSDEERMRAAGPEDPALLDLIALRPGDGADRQSFEAHVRKTLLHSPLIRSLDASLTEPLRFGGLCQWLQSQVPDLDRPAQQVHAQTLVRWLTYFCGDLYSISTPRHSEILSLRRNG